METYKKFTSSEAETVYQFDVDPRAVLVVIRQYDKDGDEVSISNINVPPDARRVIRAAKSI